MNKFIKYLMLFLVWGLLAIDILIIVKLDDFIFNKYGTSWQHLLWMFLSLPYFIYSAYFTITFSTKMEDKYGK